MADHDRAERIFHLGKTEELAIVNWVDAFWHKYSTANDPNERQLKGQQQPNPSKPADSSSLAETAGGMMDLGVDNNVEIQMPDVRNRMG